MKKNKMKSIQLLFLLISIHLMGQKTIENTEKQTDNKSYIPYFLKCYEADSLYFAKNYEKSFQILDSLFQEYEPKNSFTIYEYETYVKSSCQIGNFEHINEKISKMIGDFGYEKEFFLADSTDVLFKGFQKANINENDYGLLRFNYLSKIDREMRKEVYSMDYYVRYYMKTSGEENWITQKRKEVIENNKNTLMQWFDSGIYPNSSIMGNYNVDEYYTQGLFEIIIQFEDTFFNEYIEPKLKYFLEIGECTPVEYANIIDYKESENKKTIYKTLIEFLNNDEDNSKINLERKKIGLPSVEYSIWKMALWKEQMENQK